MDLPIFCANREVLGIVGIYWIPILGVVVGSIVRLLFPAPVVFMYTGYRGVGCWSIVGGAVSKRKL
jgi:hypothetical protein